MTEEQGVDTEAVASPSVEPENLGVNHAVDRDIVFMMALSVEPNERPDVADFVKVEPRNISSASISFYCNEPPEQDSIVLLMGKISADPIYVSAMVTSCNEGFWERKRRYLVGCELTGRL